ncbi:LysR family transcriptional regulator [Hydrogenophaga palleronii]|uniref:LysR family transcriptional regulator n=1 Tax=Hydrogenophaga palleronii TaxID=65655 RepID=UPI000826EBFF|nr:LysR family transcriptional regulator [Hydrogenophaga palleronii]
MTALTKERHIEWRQWRQFLAVAEELHFGRAAARLHMTQPPLTQAIAGLEQALGVRLFERTKRSVALTPAGAALLPEVQALLARAATLPPLARAAAAGELGRLRLAFVSTVGFELLPRWVRAFRQRWPQVALELIEATGDVQMELLARGEVDAGMLLHSPGFQATGLAQARMASEPLVVALPEAHPLAALDHPGLAALLAEPLVIFPRRILPTLHDGIFALYHAAGLAPRVAQEAIQMQTIVNLVSAGLGVAWVPQSVRQFQRPGVVYRSPRPSRGRSVPVCETSLVWRTDAVSPTLAHFIAFAQAQQGQETTPRTAPRTDAARVRDSRGA